MSDSCLIRKEIMGVFNTKTQTKQQQQQKKECERFGKELITGKKGIYISSDQIQKIVMQCRISTPKAIESRSRLGFNQHDIMLTKEQSALTSIIVTFEGERIQTQYRVLGYKIDHYFCDYRLAIELDEKGYNIEVLTMKQKNRRQ